MAAKKSMKFHRMYLLKGRFINTYILFTALRKVVSKEYMKVGKDAMTATTEGCRMLLEPTPISEIDISKKQHGIDVQGIVLSDSGILGRSGKKLREINVGDHSKYCVRPGSRKAAEHHCVRTPGEGVGGRRGRAVGRWRPRGRDGGAFRFSHQGDAVKNDCEEFLHQSE